MADFYTNVVQIRGDICLRGYKNGVRHTERIKYKPYLFVSSSDPLKCDYKTTKKQPVAKVDFNSIGEAREYIKRYKDVSGYEIHGMTSWVYPFIYDNYGHDIDFDIPLVKILWTDIETDSSGSFPNIREADKEINAVTLRCDKKNIVLGYFPYTPKKADTVYIHCKNEIELLSKLISIINKIDPDIVCGWNSSGFDIPYITNRCEKILGIERTKKLSPWGIIERKTINIQGREVELVSWAGIACLDYIDVYKKFRSATQESYKLDYIAMVELGVGKLDYSEYGSLDNLYKQNVELYYDYNIVDTERLDEMEEKLHLFDILMSLAYLAGCNYQDSFATVRPWDVKVHNYLMDRKIVVPQNDMDSADYEGIEGAYVKDPVPGLHRWSISVDVDGLYPSVDIECNISPETLITTIPGISVDDLLSGSFEGSKLQTKLREQDAGLCATGCIFDNSVEGFIPAIMRQSREGRQVFKDKYTTERSNLQKIKEEMQRRDLM